MNNSPKELIFQDDDISIYEKKFTRHVPTDRCIGGYIYVVNNHNNEQRWKDWKWYQYENGEMFNDREMVIDMLSGFVKELEDKEYEQRNN